MIQYLRKIMNILKKLKDVVNDIVPNEIKNNDLVKGSLLATGLYYGFNYAPDNVKNIFTQKGFGETVQKGKGFLFGTPSTIEDVPSIGKKRIKVATSGIFGEAGKFSAKKTFKKGYEVFKTRQSLAAKGEGKSADSAKLVPSISEVNVTPSGTASRNLSFYQPGNVRLVGIADERIENALAQVVASRNFVQFMNGEIPMEAVSASSASGPTIRVQDSTVRRIG